ncbi:MAG: putative membrane protein [Cyclobacteriaceae bacterium]|jgi:uncharacterized membrane protein
MEHKTFVKKGDKDQSENNRNASMAINSTLYIGVLITIAAMTYMTVYFYEADDIIHHWLPFMVAGIVLIFISQLIKWLYSQN